MKKPVTHEGEHRQQRILPIDKETLEMIKGFEKRGGPLLKNERRLLFPINRHRAWQIMTQCAERAALPKLVNPESGKMHNIFPHRLRDSFEVNAVKTNDSGDGLRMLQEHLGHQSFNTTAKYRKIAGEEQRQWYDGLWKEKKA